MASIPAWDHQESEMIRIIPQYQANEANHWRPGQRNSRKRWDLVLSWRVLEVLPLCG